MKRALQSGRCCDTLLAESACLLRGPADRCALCFGMVRSVVALRRCTPSSTWTVEHSRPWLCLALLSSAYGTQMDATKLLALLLEAPDARRAAEAQVNSLTEEFFHIASTYLTMVRPTAGTRRTERLSCSACSSACRAAVPKLASGAPSLSNRRPPGRNSATTAYPLAAKQGPGGYRARDPETLTSTLRRQRRRATPRSCGGWRRC